MTATVVPHPQVALSLHHILSPGDAELVARALLVYASGDRPEMGRAALVGADLLRLTREETD